MSPGQVLGCLRKTKSFEREVSLVKLRIIPSVLAIGNVIIFFQGI